MKQTGKGQIPPVFSLQCIVYGNKKYATNMLTDFEAII